MSHHSPCDLPLLPAGTPWPAGPFVPHCLLCYARGFRTPGPHIKVIGQPAKAKAAGKAIPLAVVRCSKVGERVRVAGSDKAYYRCGGGHGSTTADARRGLVTDCRSCTGAGVWRIGGQCGPGCPGYVAAGG